MKETLIEATCTYVKETLAHAESGHNWFHIERVWKNARAIGAREEVNMLVVELAALLHDIADAKFNDGDEEIGPATARAYLEAQQVEASVTDHVVNIVKHISFKGGNFDQSFFTKELAVVQDADRLDAIGAIGIARAFHYGGFKNREIYDPAIPPDMHMSKEAYKKSTAPTINHFYEKLLRLKDRMNTEAGKRIAEKRHAVMEQFLSSFYAEWNAEDL